MKLILIILAVFAAAISICVTLQDSESGLMDTSAFGGNNRYMSKSSSSRLNKLIIALSVLMLLLAITVNLSVFR